MKKKDWRGLLAVMVTVFFFGTVGVTLLWRPTYLGEVLKLDTLVMMGLQFYFTVKQDAG